MPTQDTQSLRNVPEANQPGHHPAVEQDKPTGPPPGPPRTGTFAFDFHPLFRLPARLVGVTPRTAHVELTTDSLDVRFGPWRMTVPRDDIVDVARSGPYRPWRVIGPPHLSFADRGITFATTPQAGLCLRLREPAPGIEPTGTIRHPGLTVTVADIDGLLDALS
jgi:hypothetical protein